MKIIIARVHLVLYFLEKLIFILIIFFLFSTFVCPTEIIAFSDRIDEFRKIGCEVVAASTDSHFSHLAWVNTPRKQGGLGEMSIPLLADKSGKIAREYGVLNEETGIPYRGLFIIDGKGNLRQITINDLPVGRSVDETLRLVQAFQYTDIHGEGEPPKLFKFCLLLVWVCGCFSLGGCVYNKNDLLMTSKGLTFTVYSHTF